LTTPLADGFVEDAGIDGLSASLRI